MEIMKALGVVAAAIAVQAAHAGTYTVLQDNDCKLLQAADIAQAVQKAGKDTGLQLSKDMAVRAEVQCMPDGASKRFVYSIRAAIEKSVNDGEVQRWAVIAHTTGYGTVANSAALLREVRFTVRDVIRQEP